jgi:hypothetical protein
MLVPIFTVPLAERLLPLFVAYARVKSDENISASKAEHMLRPLEVDLTISYIFVLLWSTVPVMYFWWLPGPHLQVLWESLIAFAILSSLVSRMIVLRWGAQTYFMSDSQHNLAGYCVAAPMGLLLSRLMSGWWSGPSWSSFCPGFFVHMVGVELFLRIFIPWLLPRIPSVGTTYETVCLKIAHSDVLKATYVNTNPVEVLRNHYIQDGPQSERLILFRLDKWYLQDVAEDVKSRAFGSRQDLTGTPTLFNERVVTKRIRVVKGTTFDIERSVTLNIFHSLLRDVVEIASDVADTCRHLRHLGFFKGKLSACDVGTMGSPDTSVIGVDESLSCKVEASTFNSMQSADRSTVTTVICLSTPEESGASPGNSTS